MYGRWTVIRKDGYSPSGAKRVTAYLCRCECGNEVRVAGYSITSGRSKSCGCLQKEVARDLCSKHGMSETLLYKIWVGMRSRCSNIKGREYKRYCGRGICVCEEWEDFPTFSRWALNNGYSNGLTIDRINNDGNYAPENCRWVTRGVNASKTCRNRKLLIFGEEKTVSDWSRDPRCNVSLNAIYRRLKNNWDSLEDIISIHPYANGGRGGNFRRENK